ncbi:MAG: hypothetical protein WB438_08280 [Candidatus Cybelea sp.]
MPMPPATPLSQPGIFNVLDPWYNDPIIGWTGMVADDDTVGERNAAVLQAIITYAQTTDCSNVHPYGAIILFPGHSGVPVQDTNGHDKGAEYFVAVPDSITEAPFFAVQVNCNWPLRFLGTGSAKLTMVANDNSDFGDMFLITTGGADNTGGITFEDLYFKYPMINESGGIPDYAAIHVPAPGSVENLRIVRCAFWDCPIGVWVENGLQCSILQCTIYYHSNTGIGIWLGDGMNIGDSGLAKQVYVAGCLISNDSAHGAPPGGTGILIMGADQVRIVDSDVGGFARPLLLHRGHTDRTRFISLSPILAFTRAPLSTPH